MSDIQREDGDLNATKNEYSDLDESAVQHLEGGGVEPDQEKEHYGATVRKRISKEVNKRKQAAREAQVYRSELEQTKRELAEMKANNVKQQQSQLETETEALTRQAAAAMEEGDVDKYMEYNNKLLDSRVKLANLESQATAAPPDPAPTAAPQAAPTAPTAAPVEEEPSEAAKEWMAANNDWLSNDKAKYQQALSIEQTLVNEGYDVEDPDTYAELDRRMNPTNSAGMVNVPGSSIPNTAGGKRSLNRQDLIDMHRYGFDENNPAHRAHWLKTLNGAA